MNEEQITENYVELYWNRCKNKRWEYSICSGWTVVIDYAGLGSTNISPTMLGGCTWQLYFIVPGLSAVNDTVWMCPLSSGKVPTPSTVIT